LRPTSGGLGLCRGVAGWRGSGEGGAAELAARLSFLDGQGEQVAVGGEVEDDVAAVGFDGVEEGGFVEAVAGHDVRPCLGKEPHGFEVAEAGRVDEWGAAVGVHRVNGGAVLEQTGDALAVLAVERGGGGAQQFEQGWEAVGGAGVYVRACGDGGFELRKVPLLDGLEELLFGLGGDVARRCGFGGKDGPNCCKSEKCQNTRSPAFHAGPSGVQADGKVHATLLAQAEVFDKRDQAVSAIE